MNLSITIDEAVLRLFGKSLKKYQHPTNQWTSFTTFFAPNSSHPYLFKLIEVPANLHISEQIYRKKLQKLGKHLHKVKFFFVEKCFYSCFYLVQAEQNITPIKSMIDLAKESGEKISKNFIYGFLDFANTLELSNNFAEIDFNLEQIGTTSSNQFKVANYELYFQCEQRNPSLRHSISYTLFGLIGFNPNDNHFDMVELYSICEEEYGNQMVALIEKFIENDFRSSSVSSLITNFQARDIQIDNNTTISESYIQEVEEISESLMEDQVSTMSTSIKHHMIKVRGEILPNKKKLFYAIIIIVMLAVMVGIGLVAIKYFHSKEIVCGQSQYADLVTKQCLSCSVSCQSCLTGSTDQCTSCKGNNYLIVNDTKVSVGSCAPNCQGQIISIKKCMITQSQ